MLSFLFPLIFDIYTCMLHKFLKILRFDIVIYVFDPWLFKKLFLSSFDVIDVLYKKQFLLDIIYIVYILLTEYFF